MRSFMKSIQCYAIGVLSLFTLPLTVALSADEVEINNAIPAQVKKAIEITQPVERNTWAYTRTETEGKTIWIETFNPEVEPMWSLISVNGAEPTDAQRKKRKKSYVERAKSDDYIGENDFAGLGHPDSWTLVETTDKLTEYSFKPKAEDKEDEKVMRFVQGKLFIDNASGAVHAFELYNSKPFKPVAVAKINKFNLRIEMTEVETGVYLPLSIFSEVNGKALFKKFNEKSLVELSDFRKAK